MGIGELTWKINALFKDLSSKAAELVKANRLVVVICCGALGLVFALLIVLAVVRHLPAKVSQPAANAADAFAPLALSPEDFFMPGEPDFVPEVILEREAREGWSEEDARPFWTDPLEGNENQWKKRIENEVDKLLERVP